MKGFMRPPRSKKEPMKEHVDNSDKQVIDSQNILHIAPLLEVINRLWRIQTTVNYHGNADQKEFSLIKRNVESALDEFAQAGFTIQDHTDEKIPDGGHLSWKVLTYQEDDAVSCDVVIETVKPSIYFGTVQVQRGEVVIATPVKEQSGVVNSSTEVEE